MNKQLVGMGILVLLLFSSIAIGLGSASAKGNPIKINERGVRGYTSHGVIRINNDTDFKNLASQEGWPGDGSQSNPYIISGYEIDAQGAGNAIYIGNTTVYFVVENCYLHGASYQSWPYFIGDGIMLYNVTNGKISENNITNNEEDGIYLDYSNSNTISGNTITNNYLDGIHLAFSSSNTISGNNISNNNYEGIHLASSSSNTISGNSISNNNNDGIDLNSGSNTISGNNITNNSGHGIEIYLANSNTISGNNITNNSGHGIYLEDSSSNTLSGNIMIGNSIFLEGNKDIFITQTIYTNNTVNEKSVYYYKNVNMNNATVPLDAGEVICGNVSWLKIEDLNLSSGTVGIEIGYSSHITISGNNITNNRGKGIYLYWVNSNTISGNNITNNSGHGIYLYWANSNTISGNNITNNSGHGIWLEGYSSNNIIRGNNITNNNNDGIYLYYSSSNTIYNNLISNNTNYAIYIHLRYTSSSSHNLIYNNSFYYNHGSGDVYDSSHVQAYDDCSNNYWDLSSGIGNYWHDWANNNDTNDKNNDGIVDWPYKIDGSAGAKDYYPLKNPSLSNVLSHPMNLTARAGDGYVNLTWDQPVYGNNTVTEYHIYRNGVFLTSMSATQLYYNDTNVVNGQEYTYYVTANNSVGESEKSNEVQATPGEAVPEFSTGIWLFIVMLIAILGVVRFRGSS